VDNDSILLALSCGYAEKSQFPCRPCCEPADPASSVLQKKFMMRGVFGREPLAHTMGRIAGYD